MVSLNLSLENVEDYDWMALEEGEEIKYRTHPSIIPHIGEFIFSLGVIIASVAFPFLYGDVIGLELRFKLAIAFIGFILGTLTGVGQYLRIKSTFYVFTDDKFVKKKHIFRIDKSEAPYNKVQNFDYTQSLLDRVLNIGTVSVWTAGSSGKEYTFSDIPNPKKASKILSDYT